MTRVVHCQKAEYDVYIGRPTPENNFEKTKWGNPFKIGRDGTREEVLQKYREWISNQPELLNDLHELRGKTLGCWCKPDNCHGDTLASLADATEYFEI